MSRRRSTHDISFHGGPEDMGGHFPGKLGNKNPKRTTLFSSTNQPKRKRKPLADYGWTAWNANDPARRPESLPITDFAELGADMLEELVPYKEGGRVIQVPCIYAAIQQGKKHLFAGSRRDWTETMKLLTSTGAFERLNQRQHRRASEIERLNSAAWNERSWALKSMITRALNGEEPDDGLDLEELIGVPMFKGEEDRLLAELQLEYAQRKQAEAQEAAKNAWQKAFYISSPEPEEHPIDDEVQSPEVADSETGDNGLDACDPHDPHDLAHGHLGTPSANLEYTDPPTQDVDAESAQTGAIPVDGSDSIAPENTPTDALEEPDSIADATHPYLGVGPPPSISAKNSGPKPSAEGLKKGERLCWIEKGPGDQEIRNKGGWQYGAKPMK